MAKRAPEATTAGVVTDAPARAKTDTDAALEAITDAGLFERIAVAALRIDRPQYTLSTLGVNADHKTVKAAVDAFGRDHSSVDNHVVLAAHATSPRDKLKKKWLYDSAAESARRGRRVTTEDGDVVKAARVATAIRAEHPEAKITLVLTTNRVPSLDLHQAILAAEQQYDLTIEVFDRSSITHVLDFTPNGTAVRRALLGIETDRVSRGLLAQIGQRGAVEYARWHQEIGPDEWADRATALGLTDLWADSRFVALVGQSGFGKSAVALQALRAHLQRNGVALWVRGELVERASSLDSLLDLALHDWHPSLEPDAAGHTLQLSDTARPVVLVVDDIMRSARPQQTLATLYVWSKPPDPRGTARIVLVVPVWPNLWETLGLERAPMDWVRVVSISALGEQETADLLRAALARRGVSVSEPEAAEAARRLGGDPFLSSLLVATIAATGGGGEGVFALAGNTLARYVQTTIGRVAAPGGGGTLTVSAYRYALDLLAHSMLEERLLEPTVEAVRRWCAGEPEAWRALSELMKDGRLLFEDVRSHEAVLRFRHDRLRDATLAEAMRQKLGASPLALDVVADPLFASITGAALVDLPTTRATLQAIAELTPAALAESLRAAGSASFANRDLVVDILRVWSERVATVELESAKVEATLQAIVASMAPEVLQILAPLPRTQGIALARLAHGSLEDGLWAIAGHGFGPGIGSVFRDQAIALLLHRHGTRIVSELADCIRDEGRDEQAIIAAVTLAGFIRAPELAAAVDRAWRRASHQQDAIVAGFWAQARCAPDEDLPHYLDPLLDALEALPDEKQPPIKWSSRDQAFDEIGRAVSRAGIRDSVASYLGEAIARKPELEWQLLNILRRVDSPAALRVILSAAVKVRERVRTSDGFSPWLATLASDWDGRFGFRRQLSEHSREYLRERWLDRSEPDGIRHEALRLWVVSASADEVGFLRTVPPESPLFDTALWNRARLGDQEAVEPILDRAEHKPTLYHVSAALWGPRLRASVERALAAWSSPAAAGSEEERHYANTRDEAIRDLLGKISPQEATEILQRYWSALRRDVQFVRLALLLATNDADRLVADAVEGGVAPEDLVRYVGLDLYIGSDGEARFTRRHLRSIEPYLDALGAGELRDLAGWSHRHARDWAETHLVARLPDELRRNHFPTDDDLDSMWLEQRKRDSQLWKLMFEDWIEKLASDPMIRPRILPLVERQLSADASTANFTAASIAVRVTGSRADIALLERYAAEANTGALALIEDTRYAVAQRTGTLVARDT